MKQLLKILATSGLFSFVIFAAASVASEPKAASAEALCVLEGADANGNAIPAVLPEADCTTSSTVKDGKVTTTMSGIVPNMSSSTQRYEHGDCYSTVAADGPDNDDKALGKYTCVKPLTLKVPVNGCPQLCQDIKLPAGPSLHP